MFSLDGTRILTASEDGTARLWAWLTAEAAAEELRDRLGQRTFTPSECAEYRIEHRPADS